MGSSYIGDKSMAIKSKKGVIFTLVAIILVLILILIIFTENEYRLSNKMSVIEIRVETINDFIKSVEKDLNRGLYITSFRALLGIQSYISANGTFLNDTNAQFKELLLNGTIENQKIEAIENFTFTNWTGRIKDEAEKIDISANFSIINLTIYQQDPWSVTVDSLLILDVRDKRGIARWIRNENIKIKLDIQGFEDPLYTINSFNRVINIIKKANETDFSVTSNLINHINNSYYIESNTGPDFLMRLEGKTSNSTYGIESLVNIVKFSNQELPTYEKSSVDYLYFQSSTAANCVVNETYQQLSWFRLDNGAEPYNHLDNYKVNCLP